MSNIPETLLRNARRDWQCRGRVRPEAEREPIICEGQVVGFCTPHTDKRGRHRLGPIYIMPEYRNRGLVTALYLRHGQTKDLDLYVAGDNPSAMRAAIKAGFTRVCGGPGGGSWMHRNAG